MKKSPRNRQIYAEQQFHEVLRRLDKKSINSKELDEAIDSFVDDIVDVIVEKMLRKVMKWLNRFLDNNKDNAD